MPPMIFILVNFGQGKVPIPAVRLISEGGKDLNIVIEGFSSAIFPSLWTAGGGSYDLLTLLLLYRAKYEGKMAAECKENVVRLARSEFTETMVNATLL